MRWLTVIIFAYLLLGLEQGLSPVWVRPGGLPGGGYAQPDFLLILMVFIALWAPWTAAIWSAIFLGLLYDLTHSIMVANAQVVADTAIIGPGVIAFVLAGLMLLRLRGLVYRSSLLTVAIFTGLAGLVVHATIMLIFIARSGSVLFLPDEHLANWLWSDELVGRFFGLVYTVVLSIPLGWLLHRASQFFGFESTRGSIGRR